MAGEGGVEGDSYERGGGYREKQRWIGVVEGEKAELVEGAKEVGSEGTCEVDAEGLGGPVAGKYKVMRGAELVVREMGAPRGVSSGEET